MASIRIVSADYYMCYPQSELDVVYSEFRGTEVRQVPVIQIFGSTKDGILHLPNIGQKTCLNVHGVFPYVYIPYDGIENAGILAYKIASELDKTINISLGQSTSNTCHIHNIVLTSGLPIYGYHEKQHQFFKIYFYNPAIIKKACNLLENGAILGKSFQPHEAHFSYILQFMVDYNLHGMSFLETSQVKYRFNPKYPDQLKNIPKDKILPISYKRRSVCELELDCFACDIINNTDNKLGSNPGITALWEDEKQRRRDKQQNSQISFCLSQERDTIAELTKSHEFYAQRLIDKLANKYTTKNNVDLLDNSVYPAETPDDSEYTITPASDTNASNIFDDTIIPDSQNSGTELSQTDKNLLEILKELKENVHIEDDSVLSQAEPESGEEVDDVNLTLPLHKNDDDEVPQEDIWNDSFWNNGCPFSQLDGSQDINTVHMDEFLESGNSEAEITSESSTTSTMQEFRYANEVFIARRSSKTSTDQELNPGINILVTTEPKFCISEKSRVKILSDLLVKPDCNVKLSWNVLAKQLQLQLNIEKNDEFVDPLPFADDGYFENDLNEFDINEIVLNDVNMGNLTPTQNDTLVGELTPKTPNAHANQCSCRQSPCNSGNRLFGDDMNLFNDRLYENNVPSSGDIKTPVHNNSEKQENKTLDAVRRNLKLILSKKKFEHAEGRYNLRSLENTPKDKKKCCILCVDGKHPVPDEQVLINETKVKIPQLRLKKLLKKMNTKKQTGNDESVLVQIPLTRIFNKRERSRKKLLETIDAASTTTEDNNEINLKITETNNNETISTENELINIPLKKRTNETSESENTISTTESETENNTITDMNCEKKLTKLKLMNWNLDGQNDTPSSDSEHSQKDQENGKIVKTRSAHNKSAAKFRVSGLTKIPNKITSDRTTRNSLQKNKIDTNIVMEENICNGSFTSPRLLRNRKSNENELVIPESISLKNLRKRKSEIETNFKTINDEFKENKIIQINETNINSNKNDINTNTDRPMLRKKSRYSEAERNLKRQKRLSLSLKHLRDKQQPQPEINENLKELRVSLTQIQIPPNNKCTTKNTTTTTTTIKDVKIILEPLSPRTLEKYSSKNEICVESGNQRVTRNLFKESQQQQQQQKEEVAEAPETPEIENKRITRQSIQQQQPEDTGNTSPDSCDEILGSIDELLIKKLNTTPTKKVKMLSSSPKRYTPLNVVKSPRTKATNEIEPFKKRLRNFDPNQSFDQETLTKKVKISAIDDDCSRGIGELQDYPIIQDGAEKKIPEAQSSPPPLKDSFEICDTPIYKSPLKPQQTETETETDTDINNHHQQTLIECNNFWKQKEENFLNEIESICKNATTYNSLYYDENILQNNNFKTPPKLAPLTSPEKNRKIPEKLVLRSSPEKLCLLTPEKIFIQSPSANVTPKKSIITSADYLDYSPFASPEKGTVSLPFFFNSRETLSQQFEKELEDDSEQYYTKTKNLTIAEKYDLERNFAPQPGTSKEATTTTTTTSDNIHFEFSQNLTQASPEIESINSNIWMPKYYPPSADDIKISLPEFNIPENIYKTPFYGDPFDVTRKIDVGQNVLKIPSKTIAELEEFSSSLGFEGIETMRRDMLKELYPNADLPKTNLYQSLAGHLECIIQPVLEPPSRREVIEWLQTKVQKFQPKKPEKIRVVIPSSPGNNNDDSDDSFTLSPDVITPTPPKESDSTPVSSQHSSPCLRSKRNLRRGTLQRKALFTSIKSSQEKQMINLNESNNLMNNSCQISGVTLNNTHGFKLSYENLQNAKALNENENLTILVIELHMRTRGDLNPDPQFDAIRAIFYSIYNDVPTNHHLPKHETGIIAVNTLPQSPTKAPPPPILNGLGLNCNINYVPSELELINCLIELIQKWDPDIFCGFEIELLSWGYLIERCYTIGINLPMQISRTNPEISKKKCSENFEPNTKELKLTGRIILDAWRLFRSEIALTSYTFENLMYHILHRRVPHHSYKQLSFWWDHRSNHYRKITADYYTTRTEGVLKLMDHLDLIGRTSELARLFGIQFYEVLSRGSQFRVESMMLRLAKPLNYICVSPSVQQRAKMRAPEWVPLIFEPQSRFYVDPIIVLDFQSLYPSIIIAYNYCFSTCVGRVEKLGTNEPFEFGATQLKIRRSNLRKLEKNLTFSPCGVGFVNGSVRKGILPRMLQEILETRLMVKASMKQNKGDKLLQRVLHSRQLGLKLIANVTYGYTAANFSGRMPCSEVGDSVVSKGRETLERAIRLIEKTDKWRAKVVYGDTDSLFVQVVGRSREDAFKIGQEIADAVTRDNPAPVKLKLEKIYQPCILQTKKRYVGYMYESVDQKEPEYNAKGIETVRRDGCPAVAKMLEKSLRILFETRNVSLVKRYVCHQFEKILTGRASVQDLVFAREYRGASGYRPGACVPALELAKRWTAVDKRKEPRRGERVPYIVVHGPPGVPLIRLVRCPTDLLNLELNQQMLYRPNAVYYITKVIIPPLNRCFTLIGADVHSWYNEMPRKQLQILPTDIHLEKSKKSTISEYFATMNCVVCNNQTRNGLCENCFSKPQNSIVVLQEKINKWERVSYEINQICESCCGRNKEIECTSLDCPILYRLIQSKRDLKQVPFLRNLICKF